MGAAIPDLDVSETIIEDTTVSMGSPGREESLLPAPGRGQYDRALSRERRQAEQRERLLVATAAAFVANEHSVSGVVRSAGVGRNTFYEYFDDFAHALEGVRTRALGILDAQCTAAFAKARTPIERLRTVTYAWCEVLLERRNDAVVLLCSEQRRPEQALSAAGQLLASAFERVRREAPRAAEHDSAATAAAAAAEALALQALAQELALASTATEVARVAIRLLH